MIAVPYDVVSQYDAVLKKQEIPVSHYGEYRKWLRFFLDFCAKYPKPTGAFQCVEPFLEKLREKKQSEGQRKQAAHAIALYCAVQKQTGDKAESIECASDDSEPLSQCLSPAVPAGQYLQYAQVHTGSSHYCDAGYQEKSDSPEWDAVLATMAGEIKVRHYSRKTLKTYANWSRQFQRFLKNKPPQELTTSDVKEYLTFLAVKCRVASSTQNQALSIG